MLPSRPSWKCQTISSIHPTKSPIRLFWRDPVECLESLFSNPLFHNKLDFIPRCIYKTAEQLFRVYLEWLMGDSAWEMQTRLPRGATVLSTILSSDKTNITTMTGARVAHPLLLGLTNIHMYRLVHECLSIILKPLMKAAEVGIMMSDPVGNIHHCFTPLTAYIVDTPEAAMLACVYGKTSPFTMALYLQFGDNFQHPAHTRSITLGQLANIMVNPDDLEAYFEACADSQLNGMYAPFWMDWPLADPSIFLTPESLHHWHKEFYDHDLQWCIMVVGAQELNFRFSILQPTTGYCHFSGGISKLKQATGRGHHDIQRYIVGIISGAAPRCFIIAIHALMDLRYLALCPAPDDDILACIDRSLSTFHKHKDIILTLGTWMGTKKPI
ncbi:uncharacterized protein F5891DRAFT_1130362 [Suillus fuscotomentosus]|uniref:Uncharacterized protein n=1 Tax=Suillus fuscotomentosus TaxID=1912939 RepID=A0AAD4DYI9_9AGAM|nr:uncharacterized protein F5891DRAFT_1130362 [Suillus fuscotomentosus]KAG1896302.1 hypothetical protein F5891DRAFT_1130362 [Suillus fuscotomentosus]